jgi:hypothetical protein
MIARLAGEIAMLRFLRASIVAAFALALSGCFKSDYPLLNAFNSQTPVAEGSYSYIDTDKKRKTAIVTHDGAATKFITTKDDGSALIQTLLMRPIGEGYYVVMDDQNDYGLIDIRDGEVIEYTHANYCNDIAEIAQMERSAPSDYGVAVISGSDTKTCTFTSVDGLVEAMETLIERDALDPMRIYTRQ